MPAALGLDDAVLDLIAHPEAVPAADPVGFEHQRHRIAERHAVQRHRLALVELDDHLLGLDRHIVAPEGRRP